MLPHRRKASPASSSMRSRRVLSHAPEGVRSGRRPTPPLPRRRASQRRAARCRCARSHRPRRRARRGRGRRTSAWAKWSAHEQPAPPRLPTTITSGGPPANVAPAAREAPRANMRPGSSGDPRTDASPPVDPGPRPRTKLRQEPRAPSAPRRYSGRVEARGARNLVGRRRPVAERRECPRRGGREAPHRLGPRGAHSTPSDSEHVFGACRLQGRAEPNERIRAARGRRRYFAGRPRERLLSALLERQIGSDQRGHFARGPRRRPSALPRGRTTILLRAGNFATAAGCNARRILGDDQSGTGNSGAASAACARG